jgi:hypothetical protein
MITDIRPCFEIDGKVGIQVDWQLDLTNPRLSGMIKSLQLPDGEVVPHSAIKPKELDEVMTKIGDYLQAELAEGFKQG